MLVKLVLYGLIGFPRVPLVGPHDFSLVSSQLNYVWTGFAVTSRISV